MLNQLPTEVLSLILKAKYSWLVFELWKTGDRTLQAKLSHGGVQEIELLPPRSAHTTQTWPGSLANFQPRSLLINCGMYPLGNDVALGAGLSQLFVGLRSLSLICDDAEVVLFLRPSAHPVSPRQGSDRASDGENEGSGRGSKPVHYELSDLVARFAHLEELKVGGTSLLGFTFGNELLAMLPRTLGSLDLQQARSHYKFSSYDDLPPQLERLIFPNQNEVTEYTLRMLPPRITDLAPLTDSAKRYLAKNPDALPNLPFPPYDNYYDFSTSPRVYTEAGNKWHPRLDTITMSSMWTEVEALVFALPRHLTCLDMQRVVSNLEWSKKLIKTLPLTLKTLKLASVLLWHEIDNSDWPPQLASFHLYADAVFCSESYHRLPRTIETLDLVVRPMPAEDSIFHEDHLLELGRKSLEGSEKQRWSTIRQELLERGQWNKRRDLDKMEAFVAEIEKGSLFGMPLSITTLKAAELCKEPSNILLPPKLRSLYLKMADRRVLSFDFWYLLPPQLSYTKFEFDNQKADWTSIDGASMPDASSFFRSHQLDVFHLSADGLAADLLIESLPRSLRSLHLYGVPKFQMNSTTLALLPPRLESLILDSVTLDGPQSSSDVLIFPQSLTYLLFRSERHLSGAEWRNLPKRLTSLNVNASVTIADILFGPRQLRKVVGFNGHKPSAKSKLLDYSDWDAIEQLFIPFWRIYAIEETSVRQKILLHKANEAALQERRAGRFGFA